MRKLLFICLSMFFVSAAVAQMQRTQSQMQPKPSKDDPAVERATFVSSAAPISKGVPSSCTKGTLLFENAPIVTHPGSGPGGSDFSWAWDNSTWGIAVFPHEFSVAVDFSILDASWDIDSIRVYAYQTGSTTTSTLNFVSIQIWDGVPGSPGANVIWGDTTTNMMTSTRFTNCYRGTDSTNTQRPIMVAVCNTPGLTLNQGFNYWLEYAIDGTEASGPWVPPIAQGANLQKSNGAYNLTNHLFPLDIFGDPTTSSCPPVSDINVYDIEDVSVSLEWTENGTATEWLIEAGPTGFTPGTVTPVVNTSNPLNLTGLTPGTHYDVYVRAFCAVGDTSIYSLKKSFLTLNCPSTSLCEYEFVMTDDWGDGWNDAAIEIRENGLLVQTVTMESGAFLSLPVLLCDSTQVSLTWISGNYDEECALDIIDPYGATIYSFGFNQAPNDGVVFYTFTADCASTCFPPTDLSASAITLTTAELDWVDNAGATEWDIEWGLSPLTQGTGTMITATSDKPYELTGLDPSTAYDFYVRAVCDTTHSNWSQAYTFYTACDVIDTYPWQEYFEGSLFPPLCWTAVDADGDGFGWEHRSDPSWGPYYGTGLAVSASWVFGAGALTPDNYLITPAFDINDENLNLSFWVSALDADYPYEKYSVLVSTTGNSIGDFTHELHTETLTDDEYKNIVLSLASFDGQTIYIAFRHWDCTDQFYLRLDNVEIGLNLSINENNLSDNISIYPNPATDVLNINATLPVESYKIYNALGQMVAYERINSKQHSVDVKGMGYGIYIIQLQTSEGQINKRFIMAR